MDSINTQAICLDYIHFRNYDRIASFFSEDLGLIKILFKGANRPRSHYTNLASPMICCQLNLKLGKGDL